MTKVREAIRSVAGLDVLDERMVGKSRIAGVDPLHLTIDARGSGRQGYRLQAELRRRGVLVELATTQLLVAVLGLGEDERSVLPLVDSLPAAVLVSPNGTGHGRNGTSAPPPSWGQLVATPREAFLGRAERVPIESAVGRVAAESLAIFPPGIPNVMPGELVTDALVRHVGEALSTGAVVRGCGDPSCRTLRDVARRRRAPLPSAGGVAEREGRREQEAQLQR